MCPFVRAHVVLRACVRVRACACVCVCVCVLEKRSVSCLSDEVKLTPSNSFSFIIMFYASSPLYSTNSVNPLLAATPGRE